MATWVHGRPQPLPVSATPLGSVSSSTPPAELSYHGRGAWSWCLEKHCLPAPEMYTIAVLSSADTTLQKPAWAKTKSCRSPVSLASRRALGSRMNATTSRWRNIAGFGEKIPSSAVDSGEPFSGRFLFPVRHYHQTRCRERSKHHCIFSASDQQNAH